MFLYMIIYFLLCYYKMDYRKNIANFLKTLDNGIKYCDIVATLKRFKCLNLGLSLHYFY